MPTPDTGTLKAKLNMMREKQKTLASKSKGQRSRALVEVEDEALSQIQQQDDIT